MDVISLLVNIMMKWEVFVYWYIVIIISGIISGIRKLLKSKFFLYW